jgi:hypothetical protein
MDEVENAYKMLDGKSRENIIWRYRSIWKDDIKMDVKVWTTLK